jgi:hypothetical protein
MSSLTGIGHHIVIECLACGTTRNVLGLTCDEIGVCPRCGYVGWAFPSSISRSERARLQSTPPERRARRPLDLPSTW